MGLFSRKKDGNVGVPEPQLTIERSMNELRLRTEAHDGTWGLGSARWEADIVAGTITFHNAAGHRIDAPMQVVGTYNTEDGTWLWGWDHPSVPPSAARAAERALEFGRRYGLEEYTTRKIACSEDLAWEFAAVACHLDEAQGAYRGPDGPAFVFMTFGAVTISKE